MGSTWPMTLRLSLMWISTVLLLALVAHGLRVEYLPIEALTGSVWAVLLGTGAIVSSRLTRRGHGKSAIVLLCVAALVACDVAVVVDSALIYDGAGYWTLNDVAPVAVVLTIASALFIAVPARALFGAWQASPQCRLVRTDT
ncbi:hypothetical protein ACPXB5_04715 [Micromonospora arida]|uniref:hypothetical protein n=1 Tax=Micromonospora arida TaxID=2203715 RepID=UPI0033D54550